MRIDRHQRFQYNIVNARPQEVDVDAEPLEVLSQSSEAPLVTLVALVCVLVLDELLALFVDGVVRQVSEFVALDVFVVVLLTSEPGQSFIIYVHPPRIY